MDQFISIASEVGFPIAVSIYLLHRIEGRLNVLIESVDKLPERLF
jgi:2-oxoglutarate dehydrogenase complex dehydrogenase (E1) component-like enzyme